MAGHRLARYSYVVAVCCGCAGSGTPASIGVVARREESTGRIIVVDVPVGNAGAVAGLESGDEVLEVDGVAVSEMGKDDFSYAVRGTAGSRVILTIRRDGLVRRVTVRRMPMHVVAP